MLAAVLSLVFSLPQTPVVTLAAVGSPEAVAVRGTTELTVADAFAAARTAAVEHLRLRWTERGGRQLATWRPFWLPDFCAQRTLSVWLRQWSVEEELRIVDRADQMREHEFGPSYQTTLWVAEDPRRAATADRQLRRALHLEERRVLVVSGGTAVLWAVLALAIGWLDRLSRGYMTARLRVCGLLVGLAVPALAFLL